MDIAVDSRSLKEYNARFKKIIEMYARGKTVFNQYKSSKRPIIGFF